ncbi:MAG: hypothetical protein GY822_31885 [Deltaproteobacteria bacterium]|nr:hypothetical protein [Deltaproteobacteria bacterium]
MPTAHPQDAAKKVFEIRVTGNFTRALLDEQPSFSDASLKVTPPFQRYLLTQG